MITTKGEQTIKLYISCFQDMWEEPSWPSTSLNASQDC